MFGKAVSPGWDESRHSGGSLQPSYPLPEDPEPGRYYPSTPTTAPTKELKIDQAYPDYWEDVAEGNLTTRKQSLWPLLLLGVAVYALLK